MKEVLIAFIDAWPIPDAITVILFGMLPIVELRGAIPLAIAGYGFSSAEAFALSVFGNALVPLFVLPVLGSVSMWLSKRSTLFSRVFSWLFERTRRRHEKRFEKLKEFALITLVAIPLPFTGAWTACFAAFVFGIPLQRAFPLIFIGVIIAGVVVLATTVGILNIWFIREA